MIAQLERNEEEIRMPSVMLRPRLSLCMIVRDNARTIGACLASIRPWVDEIVVVDTGSLDETAKICEQLGAQVFWFPWIDDFSAARNESLRHATGEWLFWMDSDDTIDDVNGRKLRQLADGEHSSEIQGYILQVHCPGPDDELTVVDHVKLFRNRPEIRFAGRIHEQVIQSIREVGGELAWTDMFVVHSGSDTSPAGKRLKIERDLRILHQDLAERPGHPFVLFNLGMTYHDAQEYDEAVHWLTRCLQVSPPYQSHVRKAHALLVMSLTQQDKVAEAVAACAEARKIFPHDPELLFRQGILAHQLGQFTEAVIAFRGALHSQEERHFSSLDPGIRGHKARHNLALALEQLQQHDRAEMQWRAILQNHPDFRPAWRALGESLLSSGRSETLQVEIAERSQRPLLRAASLLLEAKLHLGSRRASEARDCLQRAVQEYPHDPQCREALSQLLVQSEEWEPAASSLGRLTELIPGDGAAWHNLAMVFVQMGKTDAAVSALRESLKVRPRAVHTRECLQQLVQGGRSAA